MSEHDHDHDEHDHDSMDACIEACLQAHVVCTMTAQYAMLQGSQRIPVEVAGLLLDCAQICQTSADFMLRGSPYHEVTCGACAVLSRACAEACRSVQGEEELAHCAEVCDECASLCAQMAGTDEGDDE